MALLSRKEAIEYLGISERTMCKLTAERQLKFVQYTRGGKMQFRTCDLDAYIDKHVVPTREELGRRVMESGGTLRRRRAV